MYTDVSKLFSYNALLYFVIGERGCGKSYSSKKYAINSFIKHGFEFVYLRRYKTELRSAVPKFFEDLIANNEFPNHKFKVSNNKFYCDDSICGYAMPLSTANILKSTSFSKVKLIIFDEYIIDKGCYHYLQNEVTQFLDIIETIARLRDIKVLLLGNAISITNPYFSYFNLSLPYNSDVKTFKDGLILVNYIKNLEYREAKKNTRFGKLIENTEYGKYAIDNNFLRDSKAFINKRTKNCKHYYILVLNNKYYGIWIDYKLNEMFISNKYDYSCPIKIAVNNDSHNTETVLFRLTANPWLKTIVDYYRLGKLNFDNQSIKNDIMNWLSNHLTY